MCQAPHSIELAANVNFDDLHCEANIAPHHIWHATSILDNNIILPRRTECVQKLQEYAKEQGTAMRRLKNQDVQDMILQEVVRDVLPGIQSFALRSELPISSARY